MRPVAEDGIASCLRTIALASADLRPTVFIEQSRHAIDIARRGGLDVTATVDRLADQARSTGLTAAIGEDAVTAALGDAASAHGIGSDVPDDTPLPSPPDAPRSRARSPRWQDQCVTAATLQRQRFPDIRFVVPGLIPEGLTILAGRPKLGKSWMALDIAIAIAGGLTCLGDHTPAQGDVLYAALEDNQRRLQRRIDTLLSPVSTEWPPRLMLSTTWRRLDQGGVTDIDEWMSSVAEPRAMILDTLAAVRPVRPTRGYTEDYEALADLHRLAADRGVAIIVIHHTRKMEADDPVDSVSGTLGLTGCADTIAVLNRTSQGTTLYVRGRDIQEAELAVTFCGETCRWTVGGDAQTVHRSQERSSILDALSGGTDPMGPTDIAAATGMARSNVDRLLHSMVGDGQIARVGRGQYVLPPQTPAPR